MNDAETLKHDVPTSKSVSSECEIYAAEVAAANENEASKKKKFKKKLINYTELTNCNRMIFVLRRRKQVRVC